MPISSSAYAASGKQPQRTHHQWLPQTSSTTSKHPKTNKQQPTKMRSNSTTSHHQSAASVAASSFTKIALISEPNPPSSTSVTSSSNKNHQQQQQQQSFSSLTLAGKTTTLLSPTNHSSSSSDHLKSLHQPLPVPASTNTNIRAEQEGITNNKTTGRQILFKRALHLKHVKSLLLALMSIDLLITVLVHQLAEGDQLSLWWWLGGRRVKLSLINLIVTGVWLALLCAGLLFDLYAILFGSAALHLASFGLLLSLSALHFTRQIDYSSVQLAPLLGLLFAVVALHVYLLVMAALTIYLMIAVRRRQKCI